MESHDVDPTTRTVAARLDALERENHALRAEMALLKGATAAPAERTASPGIEHLSRRWVLQRGIQAAAATAAAGVLMHRYTPLALADSTYFDVVYCNQLLANPPSGVAISASTTSNDSAASVGHNAGAGPGVEGENAGTGYGVKGTSASNSPGVYGSASGAAGSGVWGSGYTGVVGNSSATNGAGVSGLASTATGIGVRGDGAVGVRGEGHNGSGVYGLTATTGSSALIGQHTGSGYGVTADGSGAAYAGVLGRNASGHGVRGEGKAGVVGTSSVSGWEGVYGQHTGSFGYGVVGDGAGLNAAGVLGRNPGGIGVRGEGNDGVSGTSVAGYGGVFKGGKAQLRLIPATTAGKPADGAHSKGELYLDAAAALFICTAAGTPGTWKRVTVS